ncbi:MAG: 30S ribosomal protein S6 [Treponemataceae bacterium]
MRKYEFMAVFTVDDDIYKPALESVHAIFDEFGIKLLSEDQFGDRTLAYPIRKKEKGRYVLFNLEADPSRINEVTKRLKLVDAILTSLFIKLED